MEATVRAKTNSPKDRILQIIPADGWRARFREEDGRITSSRIACFALVEVSEPDGTTTEDVRAIDIGASGYAEFVTEAANFAGLVHEDDASAARDESIERI